jgi:hypothetical protein
MNFTGGQFMLRAGSNRSDSSVGGNGSINPFPATAWTRIVSAKDPASSQCRPSLLALATLYDRPLLCVFRQKLFEPWKREAEDWKQDFVVSHLLSGKIFQQLVPGSRFRSYLAVAVRNYIRDRLAGHSARREVPLAYDPIEAERADEAMLSRERALDCLQIAKEKLAQWAKVSGDPEQLVLANALMEQSLDIRRMPQRGTAARKVIEQFKQLLRLAVREELLINGSEDEQSVMDREAAILIDALAQPGSQRS